MSSGEHVSISELPCDVVLRNGTVIDGSGRPAFAADVAIQGDRLVRVGDVGQVQAIREIDVTGLVVAPGFIDVHTHDDAAVIARPEMTAKLTQGVTTVIGGNCGISGAPYSAVGNPPNLLRLVLKSDQFVAPTFEGYLQKVTDAAPAINAGFLTGHTTLRMQVMGEDLDRCASESEIDEMRTLLTQCLQAGSLGLSTGLFYPPARAASTREVIEIAQPLSAYQGVYATHMRDEGDKVMDSLQEALDIGRAIHAPVIVSHHKCMGRNNFGRSVQTLALLQKARQHQPVALDVYPYTAGSTVLNEELVSQSLRTLITWCDAWPQFCGQDLSEIAHELGCTPIEAIPRLLPAGALYFIMDEDDVTRIMRFSKAMIGSDGLPEDQHPHPRLWGTFPRVLGRYVRERKVLKLEDAVHRMTGLSASQFGFKGRGQIKVGNYADLCIFDPQTVIDTATFEQPTQPAIGIHYVFVNGQLAFENGMPTKARAGRVLRRRAAVPSRPTP
jgi:N-acyl-D-amino-acid deacylase